MAGGRAFSLRPVAVGPVAVVRMRHGGRRNSGFTRQARHFGRQRQEGVALRAGEEPAAMFPEEHYDEEKDQPEAEEDRNRYDRHAWIE